jgi:CubicO group peptidase (beta-lactamase class C family)
MLLLYSSLSAEPLSQEESFPEKLRYMKGFPPKADKILSASDGSFFKFPALRYSVSHMREFIPTRVVPAAIEHRYEFKKKLDKNIDNVKFTPMFSNKEMTWKESLSKNYTDGIIILHRGKIVYEKHFGELKPYGTHAVMSVSKTFTGTLGATLVAEGVLDQNKKVSHYVPALKNSAFGDATIRNLLDMQTALKYSEDYSDPNSEIWAYSASGTPCKPKGYTGARSYYEYLPTIKKNGEHGKKFAYKTVNTDALGWVISSVTGKTIPDLISERFWKPLGANVDGYYQVDDYGIAFAGGGFNASLEDLAKFGEMIRNKGKFNGKQIIPASVFDDIIQNADNSKFDNEHYPNLKGWGYRNMWWVTNNPNKAFMARGVYGQAIYVDPKAEMVIVRLASTPTASNADNDPWSLPAYQAVADYLSKK